MRVFAAAAALCLLTANPVLAQSAYVSGALAADVIRTSSFSTDRGDRSSGNGEVVSGALRVGTSLGSRWGAELELAVPARLETESGSDVLGSGYVVSGLYDVSPALNSPQPIVQSTVLVPTVRVQRRDVTLSSVAWVGQRVSDSVTLAYLAGLGFYRITRQTDVTFSGPPVPRLPPPVPLRTHSVLYGVGPVVGLEARIELTDHLRLVPGVRLHSFQQTWIVRPAVGLGWVF